MNPVIAPGLRFHHVGCLTENMEESLAFYRDQLGFTRMSKVYDITAQQVKVCFVEMADGSFIEFVEPSATNAGLRKILKSNNPYYHMGFLTPHFDATIESLEKGDCRLVNTFHSEAFGNRRCAFLYSPAMQLIEIIEDAPAA
jgi:catechol 2,3-dioxygenase-like lactoylglutathione lyase family enzyme